MTELRTPGQATPYCSRQCSSHRRTHHPFMGGRFYVTGCPQTTRKTHLRSGLQERSNCALSSIRKAMSFRRGCLTLQTNSSSIKRRGDPEAKTVTFSYEDAEKSGIIKRGVWLTYPYRMCMMRARAFALRDKFPDVLKGLKIAEEVMDYIEGEVVEPQPKPSASIVVPTAEAAATEAKPAPKAEPQPEERITPAEAKTLYEAYKKQGKVPPDLVEFGKGFDPPVSNTSGFCGRITRSSWHGRTRRKGPK